jgi:hypothetical protein
MPKSNQRDTYALILEAIDGAISSRVIVWLKAIWPGSVWSIAHPCARGPATAENAIALRETGEA